MRRPDLDEELEAVLVTALRGLAASLRSARVGGDSDESLGGSSSSEGWSSDSRAAKMFHRFMGRKFDGNS